MGSMNLTGSREQVAEIEQVAFCRQASEGAVCFLNPAKFLQNATCYLLNETPGGRD